MSVDFPFEAVIFDMDGVIVDTEAFYQSVLRKYVARLGIDVSAGELLSLIGAAQQVFDRTLVDWHRAAGEGELSVAEAKRRYRSWRSAIPCDYRSLMFPGVPKAIAGLESRGVRLALASSSPRSNIEEVLSACGLSHFFEVVVSGAELKESKPNPAIYRHALDLLGLSATMCCCVEDSVPGITAGKRAGLTVIARREERFGFSQDDADYIVDQVDDVLGDEALSMFRRRNVGRL